MAGVGEASAIVTLIGIAPQISKAVISAASNYKDAGAQIESFGREVCVLGEILGQLRGVLCVTGNDDDDDDDDDDKGSQLEPGVTLDPGVKTMLSKILEECGGMFADMNAFSVKLGAKPNVNALLQRVRRRGKIMWVLRDKTELEYLRARVDSMKINILVMMALQAAQNHKSSDTRSEENAKSIKKLSHDNEACIKRLQMLEKKGAQVEEHARGKISSTMSVISAETAGTAASIQSGSTWSSIFRAYGWTIRKDELIPTDDAKSRFEVVEEQEQELTGTGGHISRRIRDPKVEDGQLEKFDPVPSSLDGDTEVSAWLAQESPPAFFRLRSRHDLDENAEKAEARLAVTEEEREEDETESEHEMVSGHEVKSKVTIQKRVSNSLLIGDLLSPVPASTSSFSTLLGSPRYDHGRLIDDINAMYSNIS